MVTNYCVGGCSLEPATVPDTGLEDIEAMLEDGELVTSAKANAMDQYDQLMEDRFYRKAAHIADQYDLDDHQHAKLKATGENVYNALIGNKANIIGNLGIVGAAAVTLSGGPIGAATFLTAMAGGAYYVTDGGLVTAKQFERAEDHIEEYGELDKRFADTYRATDYCSKQGAYLAAQKHIDKVSTEHIEKPGLLDA